MAHYQSFEELEIYQLARNICQEVWSHIKNTPLSQDYKLRDQINSASGSIMDNIAEDFGRGGNKEFINFLSIARGSCTETRAQLQRAFDRRHLNENDYDMLRNKCIELEDQLSKFINYLKHSERKGAKFDGASNNNNKK